ncbi:MAG TPA: hypothetical protein PLW93_04080 [Candidatus Absconditabacterales bacterium]|nr:hypothetical protein [Candidatus Absconditabacterales bacterium]HNG97421.1 hypothetical protein [Candidatus Absconditabacterales bacterium]
MIQKLIYMLIGISSITLWFELLGVINGINPFIMGLMVFVGITRWSIKYTGNQGTKKQLIVGGILVLLTTIIHIIIYNRYVGLGWLLFLITINLSLYWMKEYNQTNTQPRLWYLLVVGSVSITYYLSFSLASIIVGSNTKLDLRCDQLYHYYHQINTIKGLIYTKDQQASNHHPLSKTQHINERIAHALKETPGLNTLYHQFKSYQVNLLSGIKDQQAINQEICHLVITRIHELYNSSSVKRGVILIIGLFLTPFLVILMYIYTMIAYIILHLMIRYKGISLHTEQVNKKTFI